MPGDVELPKREKPKIMEISETKFKQSPPYKVAPIENGFEVLIELAEEDNPK